MDLKALFRDINQSDLARNLNVDPSTVAKWIERGNVPPERVLAVEAHTGLSKTALRPDLYPEGGDG